MEYEDTSDGWNPNPIKCMCAFYWLAIGPIQSVLHAKELGFNPRH